MSERNELIRSALRFFDWAAGEGLFNPEMPDDSPEEALFRYSQATGDEDWDTLPERIFKALQAQEPK